MVSHFFSPLRTLKKKARGRLNGNANNSWSDEYDDDEAGVEVSTKAKPKSNMMTGECFCCGSKVSFPQTVSCFKCTVCDTINDLQPLVRTEKTVEDGQVVSKPRTPPPPLTLDRLKAGVHAYKKHPEKQTLLEAMIRESFGNWDVLNFSFPNGKEPSSDDPGISLSEVHAAYKIILSLPSPFIRAMMNGIEQILRRPGRPLKQRGDTRYLLIIIENPLLLQQSFPQESSYHHQIVKSIVGTMANLPNRVHYSLVIWISQNSQSSLKRKATLVNQFISYRLQKYDRARRRNQTQRATPLTAYSSHLGPIPPKLKLRINEQRDSAEYAPRAFLSDIESADSASTVSTYPHTAGATGVGGSAARDYKHSVSAGLGIENLSISDSSPGFPSLGSAPPDTQAAQAPNRREQIASRQPTTPTPMYIREPEQARVEKDWADRALRRRRSKTVGGWAYEGGRSVHGSQNTNSPLSVLPDTWRIQDAASPFTNQLTPPPMAHAREKSNDIANMTGPDLAFRQTQYIPLRSNKDRSPLAFESQTPSASNSQPAHKDGTPDSDQTENLTTFIPIRSTPEIPPKQTPASSEPDKQQPASSGNSGLDMSVPSVNPFRSLRVRTRQRSTSMILGETKAELDQTPAEGSSQGVHEAHADDTKQITVRPTRDSVLGVLDGTAEPTSPAASLHPRSSLTRTRSSSEAPMRRRADHEILAANGPPSSNAVGDWGSGVDLDDYYVGADGVFYPKSNSLVMYQHDWRLVTAAKVMALLHAANLLLSARSRLSIEAFYNESIDNMDLISDYDAWQARIPGAFSFCQYPFLLSLKAKVQIMQVDAARQMDSKLKEAVISALFQSYHARLNNPVDQPHLKLLIRRRCLVEDSLHQLATHEQDLKKRLKIEFVGEDGIDAGGLTKEWFMLLVRELMNPVYGMFRRESDDTVAMAADQDSSDSSWGGAYWFNPASLETSNQYFLVGIVVGLALYNSTILDLNLPLAVFKKLLRTNFYPTPTGHFTPPSFGSQPIDTPPASIVSAKHSVQHPSISTGGSGGKASASSAKGKNGNSGNGTGVLNGQKGGYAPRYGPGSAASGRLGGGGGANGDSEGKSAIYGLLSPSAQVRYQINEMLADVAEFRPQLARGLRQLLQYRGDDVEDVFCLSFEASYDAYGEVVTVPLVPNGSNTPVTTANRVEYVTRYLQWILNDSIAKQFEPFKRGFYYVCGGNALSLFKPEEIELMVHGSDADWDPDQLEAITEYVNFGNDKQPTNKLLITWFWEILRGMTPVDRRAFLAFVTGTDRMPTVSHSQLKLKLVLLGSDYRRLPIAHTCFNQLGIWQYRSKSELYEKLNMALKESEGFGLQ
ncbi:putative E3 ubiquitin-protein ligase [Dipsacomyces acuminosporus]|nr:putative E3 ubiquitin-protein ligase [Dipsacomyces acuminosporus]